MKSWMTLKALTLQAALALALGGILGAVKPAPVHAIGLENCDTNCPSTQVCTFFGYGVFVGCSISCDGVSYT